MSNTNEEVKKLNNKKSFPLFSFNAKNKKAIMNAKNKKIDSKKVEDDKKKRKEEKKAKKKELKELYNGFNKINGYIPEYNLIINELNDYVAVIECLDFDAINKLIDDMDNLHISEIEIFSHHKKNYASIRFINSYKNIIKNKYNSSNIVSKQEKELKNINNILDEIRVRNADFIVLSLKDIFNILREKVFREDFLSENEVDNIIYNPKKSKMLFQNKIFGKKVNVTNDFIFFNSDKKKNDETEDENNKDIFHKVFGLQLYPSYLYEGYFSEINYVKHVQTCTYIKKVDRKKIIDKLNNISSGQLEIVKEYVEKTEKLYLTCFFIHIYGTKEEIKETSKKILDISHKYNVHLNEFNKQQKRAYDAFLPLMNNKIKCYRQIDNIKGILPENSEIVKYFKCDFKYGKELNSGSDFYFKRMWNGVVLSTNNNEKEKFVEKEKNYFKDGDNIYEIDFSLKNLEKKYEKNTDVYKNITSCNFSNSNFNQYEIYLLFKIWLLLCLSMYNDYNILDKNDKENLEGAFDLLERTFMYDENGNKYTKKEDILSAMEKHSILYYSKNGNKGFMDRILEYLKKHNEKLFNHIMDKFKKPTNELKLLFTGIYELFITANDRFDKDKMYIYVSHVEEIVYALDIVFSYFFNNEFKNIYMFYSYNDFLLLNNSYVCKYMFNAPYINMVEEASSDLVKINDSIFLSNNDITHLNNKVYIAGRLITKICEFNYYIEKENKENDI